MTITTKRGCRRKLTLAVITSIVAGITRAIAAWLLDHLTSGS
jgi:hypothetical protein